MEFKLTFTPEAPVKRIHYSQPILLTGSCFAQHIAELFLHHKFNVVAQPNGVVFNPISIANHLLQIQSGKHYTVNSLFQHHQLWHSWEHHSIFSGLHQSQVLHRMNQELELAHQQLNQKGTVLMITLGSAWVYKLKSTQAIVANCHKYPQAEFNKELLSVNAIIEAYKPLLNELNQTQVVFTISPVRHTKDGLVGNNRSKAVLIDAVHQLCSSYSNCYYFPAYEIVIDELRDYRFYAKDLIHPNELAIDYVWNQIVQTALDNETKNFVQEVKQYRQLEQHRVLHPETIDSQRFGTLVEQKRDQLKSKYPTVNF